LGRALSSADDKSLFVIIQTVANGIRTFGFSVLEKGLSDGVGKIQALDECATFMKSLESELSTAEDVQACQHWRRARLEDLLCSARIRSEEDISTLIASVAEYGTEWLFHAVLPFTKRNISDTPAVISLFVRVFENAEHAGVTPNVLSEFCRSILPDMVQSLTLCYSEEGRRRGLAVPRYNGIYRQNPSTRTTLEDGTFIAKLVDTCLSLGFDNEVTELLDKIGREVFHVTVDDYDKVVYPFLNGLVTVLQARAIPFSIPQYQHVFRSAIEAYIQNYVKMEPEAPRDWTRSKRGCGCADCRDLDRFLISPTQEVGRFAMAESRRKHLEKRVWHTLQESTERGRVPYTLVLRKTNKIEYHSAHDEWQRRCTRAVQQIRDLGEAPLRDLLAERYQELLELRPVKLAFRPSAGGAGTSGPASVLADQAQPESAQSAATALQTTSSAPIGPITSVSGLSAGVSAANAENPKKRKVDAAEEAPRRKAYIIDLTGD